MALQIQAAPLPARRRANQHGFCEPYKVGLPKRSRSTRITAPHQTRSSIHKSTRRRCKPFAQRKHCSESRLANPTLKHTDERPIYPATKSKRFLAQTSLAPRFAQRLAKSYRNSCSMFFHARKRGSLVTISLRNMLYKIIRTRGSWNVLFSMRYRSRSGW